MLLRVWLLLVLALCAAPLSAQDMLNAFESGAAGEAPADEGPDVETVVRDTIAGLATEDGPDPSAATSTEDLDVTLEALELKLLPLQMGDLENEAAAWRELLQERVEALSEVELELLELTDAEAAIEAGDADPLPEAEAQAAEERQDALVEEAAVLREERTRVLQQFRTVLDAMQEKGATLEDQASDRTYIAAVGGVNIDVTDTETAFKTIRTWLDSDEGGRKWARDLAEVVGILLLAWFVGWLLSVLINFGLRRTEITSVLLRRFLRVWIRRVALLIGLLFALSAMDVNITPLLAAVGALGFILAFALQSTLSNLASGLLIMTQRPFDEGDDVEAAEITGTVERVSLFSTHLSTDENKKVIVPNSMIWDSIIVNATGTPTRRLSIEVEVSPDHTLEEAESTLMDVMKAHPDVLSDPEPAVNLTALSSDGLTFVCRPWVETDKKDAARWELVSQFGHALDLNRSATKAPAA